MNPSSYCRDVESYLCRKNGGHLIRIVGPAFELVCGWEARGIPLSVTCGAIDRALERSHAKGGMRRRPLRVEFCEADVLDLFDNWRRAVGVGDGGQMGSGTGGARERRQPSLVDHLNRVVLRLTAERAGVSHPAVLADLTVGIVKELDAMRRNARTARGESRRRLVTRLANVDRELTDAVRTAADEALCRAMQKDADRDLAPFRDRMPPGAFRQAVEAGVDRLLREHYKLPRVSFE